MKKLTMLSLALTSSLLAITDAEIKNLYAGAIKEGFSVNVKQRSALQEDKSIEKIVIEIKKGNEAQDTIMFAKGDLLFNDVINYKTRTSYLQEFQMAQEMKAMEAGISNLTKLIKTEDQKNIVSLGNDPKKPTKFLFTDPLCPYCQLELKHIEKELAVSNLKVFLTPIQSHGKEALAKSIVILQESANAKTDAEKIQILRKYYTKEKLKNYPSDAEIAKHKDFADKFFQTGAIRGVPAIFEQQKDGSLIPVDPIME